MRHCAAECNGNVIRTAAAALFIENNLICFCHSCSGYHYIAFYIRTENGNLPVGRIILKAVFNLRSAYCYR